MTIRTLNAEIAFPAQCELAEGPVWDASRGCSVSVDRSVTRFNDGKPDRGQLLGWHDGRAG